MRVPLREIKELWVTATGGWRFRRRAVDFIAVRTFFRLETGGSLCGRFFVSIPSEAGLMKIHLRPRWYQFAVVYGQRVTGANTFDRLRTHGVRGIATCGLVVPGWVQSGCVSPAAYKCSLVSDEPPMVGIPSIGRTAAFSRRTKKTRLRVRRRACMGEKKKRFSPSLVVD